MPGRGAMSETIRPIPTNGVSQDIPITQQRPLFPSFSAPFLARWRPVHPRACGGNRLSASQGATPYYLDSADARALCSTPFGITGCYAFCFAVVRFVYDECSTPFGITGCYAQAQSATRPAGQAVLNAFRHHRVLRSAPTPSPAPGLTCAQRLSASQGATRGRLTTGGTCSLSAQRLSASQGATRMSLKCPSASVPCAQRLSASQGATHGHRHHPEPSTLCAQRLSASQGATPAPLPCFLPSVS